MARMIRVLVADDTDIAREGLNRILATEPDIKVVGESGTLFETIRKAHELRPDVLIMDLKWFDDEHAGIDAISRLAQELPEIKVIAITIYPHLVEQARKAGAVSALNKEIPKRQLVEEIRSVHALPSRLAPPVEDANPPAPLAEELTDREREVLSHMATGMTDRQIAEALGIAESTAKNHASSILSKLDVPNRAAAVAMGLRLGLIRTG